jgi:hypothetical protein
VGLGVGEAVDEREQARRGGQRARQVDCRAVRRHGVLDEQSQRDDGGRHGQDQVDEQRPAPVEDLRQRAAEDQAEGCARGADHAEDRERAVALLRDGERRRQQAERGGREESGEGALQRTSADEDGEARSEAADRGGDGEPGQPSDEHPLAAEDITQPPAQQEQAAKRQCVGGDDPLARLVGEAQALLGGRKRNVHDRRVEHDHQLRDADDREDQPAAPAACVCGGG